MEFLVTLMLKLFVSQSSVRTTLHSASAFCKFCVPETTSKIEKEKRKHAAEKRSGFSATARPVDGRTMLVCGRHSGRSSGGIPDV